MASSYPTLDLCEACFAAQRTSIGTRCFRPGLERLEDRAVPSLTPLISGAASVEQEAPYTLHLAEAGAPASSVQSWSINWGDGSALQVVTGDPSSVNHVFATGNQTYTISASVTDTSNNVYATVQDVPVQVIAPVVINFSSGTAVHLKGGDPDEYTSYTQNGFTVTPNVAVDGPGAHFHLINGALYTHIHDDEPGGAGVTTLQMQSGAPFMLDSLVVPQLDNTANNGSLTFTDSNGDTMTVTAGGTYTFNWGPITSFTITPNNLLDSVDQRGYVDSIAVAPVTPPKIVPAVLTNTASPIQISGAAVVDQEAVYTLHLASPGVRASTIQSWTINWGDGSTPQTVTGDPTTVTHIYSNNGSGTYTITASATGTKTVTSSLTNSPVTYTNSYIAVQNVNVNVVTPFVMPTITGNAIVAQEATYILHLAESTVPGYTIQSWTINWGDGSAPQVVTGDPATVTHVFTTANPTDSISATLDYAGNSYAAVKNLAVNVAAPVVINFTSKRGGPPQRRGSG